MEKRRVSVFGRIIIFIGVIVLLGAAGLIGYNMWDNNRAGEASDAIATQLETKIGQTPVTTPDTAQADTDKIMPTIEVDGHDYLGILEVPELGLRLPVMADWSYESLRITPCRYVGSYYTDDLVLLGHNYARHFSKLKRVPIGAEVLFTSVDGTVYHYIVDNRETIRPTDVAKMIENDKNSGQAAEWDMTLFTCNTGGQTRCAVRCVRSNAVEQSQDSVSGSDVESSLK